MKRDRNEAKEKGNRCIKDASWFGDSRATCLSSHPFVTHCHEDLVKLPLPCLWDIDGNDDANEYRWISPL